MNTANISKNKETKTYFIQTFGCQMNYSDSERMSSYLDGIGFKQADSWQNADLIVLNTCSVRQKAEDRVNGVVKHMRSINTNPELKVVLTGCIARRIWDDSRNVQNSSQKNYESRVEELQKLFPSIDIFVETKHFATLAEKLGIEVKYNDNPDHYLSYKPKYKSKFQAYVPISTGCNHFCTFCIVPFSRGKEVCRGSEEIIREVFDLVKNGFKDITLLGQTVNRWINPDFKNEFDYNEATTYIAGLNTIPMNENDLKVWKEFFESKLSEAGSDMDEFKNLKQPRDFLQLLQVLDQIPGDWWTTWVSSHPNYMTDRLIEFIGHSVKNGHQRPYLHFALQSGSNNQLKKMNRRYTFEDFQSRVNKIRKEIPNVSLSTDIIVGFINESEEEFQETIKAQQLCRFDMIYISEYSPRPGTASARLKDNVPQEVKADRKERLNDVLREIAKENNEKLINTIQKVLINGVDRKSEFLVGRTAQNKEIRILNLTDQSLIGVFVNVKVVNAGPWALEGELYNQH